MKTLLLMFGGTDFGSPGCIPTWCGGIRKVVHFAIWGAPFVGGRRFAPPYRSGKSFTPGNLSQNPLFGVHVGKWWKRRGLKFHRTVWQEGGKYERKGSGCCWILLRYDMTNSGNLKTGPCGGDFRGGRGQDRLLATAHGRLSATAHGRLLANWKINVFGGHVGEYSGGRRPPRRRDVWQGGHGKIDLCPKLSKRGTVAADGTGGFGWLRRV